jgi:hypothetical protein
VQLEPFCFCVCASDAQRKTRVWCRMDDTLLENYLNNGSSEQEKSASDEMENSASDYSEDSKTGKNQDGGRGEEDSRAGSASSEHPQSFFVMKVGSGNTFVQSVEENVWAVRPRTYERLKSASKVAHTPAPMCE